jgi:adenylate kinase family enzyme
VQRVSVVGVTGSGKSTLARDLARALAVPVLELDSVFHQAGWVSLDSGEFRRRAVSAAAAERWVIDGNYTAVLPVVWARADTVVWLDLPRRLVMWRVTTRTLRRVIGRTELISPAAARRFLRTAGSASGGDQL